MKIYTLTLIVLITITLIPMLIFAYNVNIITTNSITEGVHDHLFSIASLQEHAIEEIIFDYEEEVKLVQSRTNLRDLVMAYNQIETIETRNSILTNIRDLNSSIEVFSNILIFSLDGICIASLRENDIGMDFSSQVIFKQGNNSNYRAHVFLDVDGILKINNGGPLVFNNKSIGVIAIERSSLDFQGITEEYHGLGTTGETIIAKRNSNGDAIFITNTRFDRNASLNTIISKKDLDVPITQAMAKNEIIMDYGIDYRGKPVLAVTRYIEELDWGLVVKIDKDEAFHDIDEIRNQILMTVIITAISLIIISVILSRKLSNPIVKLTGFAQEISKGNLDSQIEIKSLDEINTLSLTLNQMVRNLSNALEAQSKAENLALSRATELEHSNRELELFASIASHDLQEPLRKVVTFANRLSTKYSEHLDDRGQDYFRRMIIATERMTILINDLLDFSRVKKNKSSFKPIMLDDVIDETIDRLELQIEKQNAKIEINSLLPTVLGNYSQLVQAFQNLISNGLKFHKHDQRPIIKIFAAKSISVYGKDKIESSEFYDIYIKDNGIGFDEKFKEKIFRVFQRLHGQADYKGTGIGLAVSKKLIEFHDGTISVKSKVGEGATFIVRLPTIK